MNQSSFFYKPNELHSYAIAKLMNGKFHTLIESLD